MGNFKIGSLMVVMACVIACAYGLTDNFKHLTGGVHDAWQKIDPASVNLVDSGLGNTPSVGFVYGGGKLWLISRRNVGTTDDSSSGNTLHYASSQGGIISTYDIARNLSWTHQSVQTADDGSSGDSLFSAGGRLFMLTYGIRENRLVYRKLFVWNASDWNEVELTVDPDAHATSKGAISNLIFRLTSSAPDGNMVYTVNTVNAESAAESVLCKIEIEFDDGTEKTPKKANVKFLARKVQYHEPPPSIGYAAPIGPNGDTIRLFNTDLSGQRFTSMWYTYDNTTGKIDDLQYVPTTNMETDDRIFQDETNIYMIGKQQTFSGQPTTREVICLGTGGETVAIPKDLLVNSPIKFAYNPKQRLLYAASLVDGIYVADVNEWFAKKSTK